MIPARELILKKRDGGALEREEIRDLVRGISDGSVSDAQIAAFAMATWFRGMSLDEQTELTLAMRDSGRVLEWSGLDGPVVDKHSTGGVGDLVSLILGPLLAACGAYVPMISGRGLGHTGGTLDKLESIPGFDTCPDTAAFQQRVRNCGIAIVGQSQELAPADRRLYAVRDVTASVSSTPLIVSSILSKKLAEGLDALVMDIKQGRGAFSETPDAARELAADICRVAQHAGLKCSAIVTNMDQPLASAAGNALEVREVVRFLRDGVRNPRVHAVVLELSAEVLTAAGLAPDAERGRRMALSALDSGAAAERFQQMVAGQGGPADFLERAEGYLGSAPVQRAVYAEGPGYVQAIDTRALGDIVVRLGGGRRCSEDHIDPAVGLSDILALGDQTGPEAPLAVVHAAGEDSWEAAAVAVRTAFETGSGRVEPPQLISGRFEGEAHG